MLFAGMMALAGAAVVDHARSARCPSKGSGPGLVPLRTRPRSWGEGGVHGLPPSPIKSLLAHHLIIRGAPGVFSGLSFAVLGCPLSGGGGGPSSPCLLFSPDIFLCTKERLWGPPKTTAQPSSVTVQSLSVTLNCRETPLSREA